MQNEQKDQGCEKIDGGHVISATFYRWSATLNACLPVPRRYDKRSPQIFRLPQSANFFKADGFFYAIIIKEVRMSPPALIGGGLAGFATQRGRNRSRELLVTFGGPKVIGKRCAARTSL